MMNLSTKKSFSQESFPFKHVVGEQDTSRQPPLVLSTISQTRPLDRGLSGLVFYKSSLKVLRKVPSPGFQNQTTKKIEFLYGSEFPDYEPTKRRPISSFSIKSKARLQHVALNANCEFTSQMTLTYDGDRAPTDGQELKSHLNKYLVALRRKFEDFKYLWVLEFQRNGNPHIHLFTNLKYSPERAVYLGGMWNRYVKGSEKHRRVHQHVPKHQYKQHLGPGDSHGSFCPWEMGSGSYICYKYLSKDNQKRVPTHFRNCGRFWGATRGIVKPNKTIQEDEFYTLFTDTINTITGEFITAQQNINRFFRDLRNYHEKSVNRARWKNHLREKKKAKGQYLVRKPKKFVSPIRRPIDAIVNKGTEFYRKWFEYQQSGFEIPF